MTPACHASVRLNPLGEVAGRCQLSNDAPRNGVVRSRRTRRERVDPPARTQHATIVDRSTDGGVSLDSAHVRDDNHHHRVAYE